MIMNSIAPVNISPFINIEDPQKRHKLIAQEVNRRRADISRAFDSALQSKSSDFVTLAHNYDLEPDRAAAIRRGRLFNLPLMKMGKILNDVFGVSAQEFMFGYSVPVELPRSLQCMADHLTQLPPAVKRKLVSCAGSLHKQDIMSGTDAYHSQTSVQLLRDRVCEFAEDHMIKPVDLCGSPQEVSVYMRRLLSSLSKDSGKEIGRINLATVMIISLLSGIAIDYLVSPNYLRYNNMVRNSTKHPMAYDQLTMQLLEQYLSCSKSSQEEIFAKVLLTQQ